MRLLALALVVLLPSVALAADPHEEALRQGAAAFLDVLKAVPLAPGDAVNGKRAVRLETINDTTQRLAVADLLMEPLAAQVAVVPADKARAVLRVRVWSIAAKIEKRALLLVGCAFELSRLPGDVLLASTCHDAAYVNGAAVKRGSAEWREVDGLRPVATTETDEAGGRLVAALREGAKGAPVHVAGRPGDVASRLRLALLVAGVKVLTSEKAPADAITVSFGLSERGLELRGARGGRVILTIAPAAARPVEPEPRPEPAPGPAKVPAQRPEGEKTSAHVAKVEGDRAVVTAGTDDGVAPGDVLDLWRGSTRLGRAVVEEALRDSATAEVQLEPGQSVQPGDSAYLLPSEEERAALAAAGEEAAKQLLGSRSLEGVGALGFGPASVLPDWKWTIVKGAFERALGPRLGPSSDPWLEPERVKQEPGGASTTVEAWVFRAWRGKAPIAAGVGRAVFADGKLVPRAQWPRTFARAYGPADEDRLLAAFRTELAKADLGSTDERLLAKVQGNGVPVLERLVEAALLATGKVEGTRAWDAKPSLEVEVRVEGEAASEGGKTGARFKASVTLRRGAAVLARAEETVFKGE